MIAQKKIGDDVGRNAIGKAAQERLRPAMLRAQSSRARWASDDANGASWSCAAAMAGASTATASSQRSLSIRSRAR